MTRVCTICTHPKRAEIDAAAIAGAGYRTIADRFTVSKTALLRHKADHLLAELVKARQAEDVTRASDLLEMATNRDKMALALLGAAQRTGDLKTAVQALRVSLTSLELLARLRGQLSEQPIINLTLTPQWVTVRAVILQALEPHPAAQLDVAAALLQLRDGARGGKDG